MQEPVSRAQAEAKEELLRARLAQLILNLDPDNESHLQPPAINKQSKQEKGMLDQQTAPITVQAASPSHANFIDYNEALREPIFVLREKLSLLEHRLLSEDADNVLVELRQISATPPPLRNAEQRARHSALSKRGEEIARMTPLIGMLRHKLGALDELCATRREQYIEQTHKICKSGKGAHNFDLVFCNN